MQFARLPDWLLYSAVVGAILIVANGRRERADAPQPPPPVEGAAMIPLDPTLPFDPAAVIKVPTGGRGATGAAFSISARGLWLTAAQAVEDCRRVVLVVAEGRGIVATVSRQPGQSLAVLTTDGGAPPLAIASQGDQPPGQRAFLLGLTQGAPAEVSLRLIGDDETAKAGRGRGAEQALAWAETGRTDGVTGSLSGLVGAPVLNEAGRVVGVALEARPRRGVLRTSRPQAMAVAVAQAGEAPATAQREAVTVDNYGRVADALRRDLSIVEVKCLTR